MKLKELYSDNLETARRAVEDVFTEAQGYLSSWANVARRSVNYANGDQTPIPYGNAVMVNNQPVHDYQFDNEYNGYHTNEIEPIVRTLASYMTRAKPAVKVEAFDKSPESKSLARCGEVLLEAKYELDNEYAHSREAAVWGLTTGNVFSKDFWDPTGGSFIRRPDDDGEMIPSEERTGNNGVAILTALSMTLDHSITNFEDQNYVGESYIRDIDWARDNFDQDGPGFTGRAKSIVADGNINDVLANLEAMKFNVPYLSQGYGNRPNPDNKCLIHELYIRPNKEWPRGRLIIIAGNQVVYSSTKEDGSPYYMPLEPIEWHPYTFFRFEPYVGRLLGKSLVEQIVPLQMRINEINRSILQNANTLAKPNILAEEGSIRRGIFNGRGANVYTYKKGMNQPFVMQGAQLPPQFFNEKQQLIDQMVRIAGTNFVMQGATPTGVKAAAAIEMLLENANTQHSDLMYTWEIYHEKRFAKKLRLLHKHMQIPSLNLRNKINHLSKNVYEYQLRDFLEAEDISDGLNVKVERGSMIPKSEAVKRRMYTDMAQTGAFGPALGEDSPRGQRMRDELISKLNIDPLKTDESIEVKKANWENGNMERETPMPISDYDVHEIHIAIHKSKRQDPDFIEAATEEQLVAFDTHIQEHEQILAQQQEQAMMEQAAMGGPEGAPPMGPEGIPAEGAQDLGGAGPLQ